MHSFSYTVEPKRDVKQTHLIGSISVEVDFLQRTQLVANHPNFLPQLITFFPSSFSSSPSFHPLLLPLPFSTLQKSSACNQHRWYGYIFSGEVLRQCLLFRPSGKHLEPAVKELQYKNNSLLSFTEMYCFQIILGSEKKIPLLKGTVLQIIGKSPLLCTLLPHPLKDTLSYFTCHVPQRRTYPGWWLEEAQRLQRRYI